MPREDKSQVGKKFASQLSERVALSSLLEKQAAVNQAINQLGESICARLGQKPGTTLDLQGEDWVVVKEPKATSTPPAPPKLVE